MRIILLSVPHDRLRDMLMLLENTDKSGEKALPIQRVTRMAGEYAWLFSMQVRNACTIDVLVKLQEHGFGTLHGDVNIIPVETHLPLSEKDSRRECIPLEAFYQRVRNNVGLKFDFLVMLFCSAVIAAMGLATNTAVVVIAGMLVAPVLRPMLAIILGVLVKDFSLVWVGFRNVVVLVFLSALIGAMVVIPLLPFDDYFIIPNKQMRIRSMWESLLLGSIVACASGISVALTLTSEAVSGIVGVALSSSVLPAAVNSGMLLSYAVFGPFILGRDKVSTLRGLEMSAAAFLLTLINIVCINVFAVLTLRVKDFISYLRNREVRAMRKFRFLRMQREGEKYALRNEGASNLNV
eukprot:TRINITY_DN4171_c0_g1_i1.p1 TRINITY_DN4171_c0_g1~~TRINITY_DN4171_c0_g1_i1.p1  ORF type:complete len:351 (-),score=111.55 TRINITY_DN4171_c0_g1_i1:185-1237(-)